MKLYTIYDSKSETYDRPWVAPTRGAAIRAFSDALKDPQAMVSKHPADFTLFEIGDWNEFDGTVVLDKAKSNLGLGIDFIEKESGKLN